MMRCNKKYRLVVFLSLVMLASFTFSGMPVDGADRIDPVEEGVFAQTQKEATTQHSEVLTGFSTGSHIYHVKPATLKNGIRGVVGAAYDGKVLGYSADGKRLWSSQAGESFPYDLFVDDIDGDGKDESMIASSDGTLYVLNHKGRLLWSYTTPAPLYNVCTVQGNDGKKYIITGGIDKHIYKLSATGTKVDAYVPDDSSNKQAGVVRHVISGDMYGTGKEYVIAVITYSVNRTNLMMMLDPDDMSKPVWVTDFNDLDLKAKKKFIGRCMVQDINKDDKCEILLPYYSSKQTRGEMAVFNSEGGFIENHESTAFNDQLRSRDYRMAQLSYVNIPSMSDEYVLLFFASDILVRNLDGEVRAIYSAPASFAGGEFDPETNTYYMASDISGGDAIYALKLDNDHWGEAFENIQQVGRIKEIQGNIRTLDEQIDAFVMPSYQQSISKDHLISLNHIDPKIESALTNDAIHFPKNYLWTEDYDRSSLSEYWATHKDKRKKYDMTAEQIIAEATRLEAEGQDFTVWAGHTTDPFYFSMSTAEEILKAAPNHFKMFIFSEFAKSDENMDYAIKNRLIPLAELCQQYGTAKVFFRNKNIFWTGTFYNPIWAQLYNEKYKDVLIISTEDTNTRTAELSLAGRMGIWLTGAVDNWGTRMVEDNASYNRQYEWSSQKTQSHYMRNMVYHMSQGAKYLQNFVLPENDQTIPIYKMIDKGILITPEREDILSISDVALAMKSPDEGYIEHGENGHNIALFDPTYDEKYVFDQLDCYWAGYPTAKHDFSNYGYGVKNRMSNFLPNTYYGMIPILPDDYDIEGSRFVDKITTDGKYFYDENNTKQEPDIYRKTVVKKLNQARKRMPVVVEGDVAWTVVRIDNSHLRIYILDSGYVNPEERQATIKLQNMNGTKAKNILTQETLKIKNNTIHVTVPAGVFSIVDVTFSNTTNH